MQLLVMRCLPPRLLRLLPPPPACLCRLGKLEKLRLGSAYIAHTGEGALLTVVEAEDVLVDTMTPDSWAQRGMTVKDPNVPWFIERMDPSKR